MTDSAQTSADLPATYATADQEDTSRATPNRERLASRFGEAAHLLDRLDLRPYDQRRPQRRWWCIW